MLNQLVLVSFVSSFIEELMHVRTPDYFAYLERVARNSLWQSIAIGPSPRIAHSLNAMLSVVSERRNSRIGLKAFWCLHELFEQ